MISSTNKAKEQQWQPFAEGTKKGHADRASGQSFSSQLFDQDEEEYYEEEDEEIANYNAMLTHHKTNNGSKKKEQHLQQQQQLQQYDQTIRARYTEQRDDVTERRERERQRERHDEQVFEHSLSSSTSSPQRMIVTKIKVPFSSALPPKPPKDDMTKYQTDTTPHGMDQATLAQIPSQTYSHRDDESSAESSHPFDESPVSRLKLKRPQALTPALKKKSCDFMDPKEQALELEIASLERKEKELTANILALIDDRIYDQNEQHQQEPVVIQDPANQGKETINEPTTKNHGRGSFLRGLFRDNGGRSTPIPLVRQDSLQSVGSTSSSLQQQTLSVLDVPGPLRRQRSSQSLPDLEVSSSAKNKHHPTPTRSYSGVLKHSNTDGEEQEQATAGLKTDNSKEPEHVKDQIDEETPVWKRRLLEKKKTTTTERSSNNNSAALPTGSILDHDDDDDNESFSEDDQNVDRHVDDQDLDDQDDFYDEDDEDDESQERNSNYHNSVTTTDKSSRGVRRVNNRNHNDYTQQVLTNVQDWWKSTMDAAANSLVEMSEELENHVDDASTVLTIQDDENDNEDDTEDKSRRLSFPATLELMVRRHLSPFLSCGYYAAQLAMETVEDPEFQHALRDFQLQ